MSAESIQQPSDVADDYAAQRFIIQSLLSRVATATIVRVVSCTNSGGVSPVGTVVVQPLVNQIAGDGKAWPHGQLFELPYSRVQGGANAIIIDPQPNDLGLVVFASRDISVIKTPAGKAQAHDPSVRGLNPGSARKFNMSDGIYVGGLLNGTPTQYVRFAAGGVTVLSPTKIRLEAPTIELAGDIVQTGGNVTASGSITAAGDVVGNGISLHNHTHGGVSSGIANTNPPNP